MKEVKAANLTLFRHAHRSRYPSCYEAGVNLPAKNMIRGKDFSWATPEYKNYGYAELIDLCATGNYYTDITIE
ncbi:hypothetical protein NXW37_29555 [Bacteroides thetaiotaomicron]|nr:hypothetical protein [Bacteroides thetaiotaomicron]